ncbi:ATP-binding cassette domain-containing protein [Motiliproteus sediminis]|uniref:ATP-binding cassette domain-containing protein n=1 Tax=Motiliproteus sediminis TaxID=1468178 RepID=UPI001AEFD2CF|nr:ATP-binding cassette domain-containing protein [Motiliproteus sediminis]
MPATVSPATLLAVEQLEFRYGNTPALRDLSFQLQSGQFHALLGPNGAGKSTLFALISRLFALQQGRIVLDGIDLERAPAKVLGRIGMVFQQSTLDLDLSVAENLNYHATLQGIGWRERKVRINDELTRVGLEQRTKERVRTLNGGHRRRVEIARALLHRPRLLLLDEATVGLDSHARTDLNRHVRGLCRDQGLGVLWATHLIEEIQPDDPVTLIHRGRLLANSTSAEICARVGAERLVDAFETLTAPRAEVNG